MRLLRISVKGFEPQDNAAIERALRDAQLAAQQGYLREADIAIARTFGMIRRLYTRSGGALRRVRTTLH